MKGGNAADAAVAMAAALNVTEPTSTGIGGDMFALYYQARTQTITALNGSGRAPAALNLELISKQNLIINNQLPPYHPHTITVPGACAGWCDLVARHGSLPLKEILQPAIELAEKGFPVAPLTAQFWARGAERQLKTARGGQALLLNGHAPRAGEIFSNPGLARTLRAVAEGGAEAFYTGEIARAIVEVIQHTGGVMELEDLAAHTSTWEEPLSVNYRGYRVWECPPNGQGLTALIALNILEGFDLAALPPLSVDRWHLLIEALRLAFADARWYISDPAFFEIPLAGLLSPEYAAQRRALIDMKRASNPQHGAPVTSSGTVYCCVVDGEGNACSFINSNYMGFGTGLVPESAAGPWGFTLQNRGHNFSLDAAHPNALAPRKRPYHTIIPGMLTRDVSPLSLKGGPPEGGKRAGGEDQMPKQELVAPFGVMGGFMQPQGHVHVVSAMLDDGLHPQAALDRLRFCIEAEADSKPAPVLLETGLPRELVEGLRARGHLVQAEVSGLARAAFGRGQIIRRMSDGVLWGGSDPRADGCALGF